MKPLRLYLPALLITALSACSSPAEPESARIGGPALNGFTLGGGRAGSDSTTQTTTTSSDTTGRGGILLGSGH